MSSVSTFKTSEKIIQLGCRHIPVSELIDSDRDDSCSIPAYKQGEDEFLYMVHVALKLRSDILHHPKYTGLNVCEEAAISCVPDSVYMFLRRLLGQSLLQVSYDEDSGNEDVDSCAEYECEAEAHGDQEESRQQSRVLSLAQDLIYSVSGEKRWTPTLVGLGSTLHQTTRSKQLVQLLHKAGHLISYRYTATRYHISQDHSGEYGLRKWNIHFIRFK